MGWEDAPIVGEAPASGGSWQDAPIVSAAPKPKAAAKPEDEPYSFVNNVRGLVEPFAAFGSALAMKPTSQIAGMVSMPLHAMGITERSPQEITQQMQEEGIYQPKTKVGQALNEYNPLALIGKGLGWLGEKAQHGTELALPPGPIGSAAGYLAKGLTEEGPALLGAKGAKMAEARIPAKVAAELKMWEGDKYEGRAVPAADIARGENAMKDANRTAFQEAGYITPPEGGIKAGLAGLAGKAKTEKIISEPNELNATRRLSAEVGTPEGAALTPEEFTRLKETTGQAYDQLVESAGPRLDVTNEFKDAVASTLAKVNDVPGSSMAGAKTILNDFWKRINKETKEPLPGAGGQGGPGIFRTIEKTATDQPVSPAFKVAGTIERAMTETPGAKNYGSPQLVPRSSINVPSELTPPPFTEIPTAQVPTLSTTWVKDQISQLRRDAGDDFRRADSNAGTARLGLANQLEELVAANLAKTGEQGLIEAYRAARENFAKIYLLERVTNDATGRVNLQKLASLSDTAKYKGVLTGEFKTAADFAKTFRKAAQKSTGEAVGQPSVFDGMFMVGSIMGGHPWAGAAELAGRYAIPQMAKRGMLQNKSPDYGPSGLSRATPDLLRALGIGSEAYSQ